MNEYNLQSETTLHNLSYIQWSVELAYVVIGIFGGILSVIKLLKINLPIILRALIPEPYLFVYFILPGIYYSYPLYSGENMFKGWAEVMELFLYMALVLHLLTLEKNKKYFAKNSIEKSSKIKNHS